MSIVTGIEWADHTFNPWIGCSRVSPACNGCYAAAWAKRYRGHESGTDLWKRHGQRAVTSASNWHQPLRWEREAASAGRTERVFCASLADVFEDRRDLDEPRARLWELIGRTPHLHWQLLTKRPEHVASMVPWGDSWPANVWLGTSVESQRWAGERIPVLARIPARVRFLSAEPLCEPVTLDLGSIDWVILGGMSGPDHRRYVLRPEWARSVRDQCQAAGAAFFFKQWGGLHPKSNGKVLDGREWCEFPEVAAELLSGVAS